MTRVSLHALSLAAALAALGVVACEGHEIAVFDVPELSGGTAGSGGAGDSAAAAGAGTAGTAPAAGGGNAAVDPSNDAGMGGVAQSVGGGGGMAGTGGTPPQPCASHSDCSPGWFCEKPSCDSTNGVCEPSPVFPNPDPMPVCGCDGVSYWNDDIRRQSGAQLAGRGECRASACTCDVGSDCKVPYASCNHLVAPGEMCGHGRGACWVLPAECPVNADPMMWQECKPPGDPPGACVDTCNAIASEKPFVPLHRGMTCN